MPWMRITTILLAHIQFAYIFYLFCLISSSVLFSLFTSALNAGMTPTEFKIQAIIVKAIATPITLPNPLNAPFIKDLHTGLWVLELIFFNSSCISEMRLSNSCSVILLLYHGALGRNRTHISPLGRDSSNPLNYEGILFCYKIITQIPVMLNYRHDCFKKNKF